MFDQLKQVKQLMSALGDPSELKAKADRLKAELAEMRVQGEAGAGAVRVTATGHMRVERVELDPAMIQTLAGAGEEADRQMIEDLIAAATNAALEKAQQQAAEHLSQLTGGMQLPGMDALMGE